MAEPVLVYDTKRPTKEPFAIHPDLAKDQRYLANKGWMIYEQVKKFEVTNLTEDQTAKKKGAVK